VRPSRDRQPDAEALNDRLREATTGLALPLGSAQYDQLARHFSLLLRWNTRINLTSVRTPREIAVRHFAESLFLTTLLPQPEGPMVDVGSGAGFPGLPLKVAWPSVDAVLLEPNQRKATFLREVIRASGLMGIEVRTDRLEAVAAADWQGRAALATMRAVRPSCELLADLRALLQPGGRVALFLGAEVISDVRGNPALEWERPAAIPNSAKRFVLVGRKGA
jgi:16S rRNA (guanine527-N7)-methyltransferase